MEPPLPVVFLHGFGAITHILRKRSVLRIIDTLQQHGIEAYAPEVDPYNTIPRRAAQWKRHIRKILRDTGHPAVHLVGFSCGGLDARYLVSRAGGDAFVRTVITVGSPHRGSSLATYILERPEIVQTGLKGLAEWMGRQSGRKGEIRFFAALEQLTPPFITNEFNPATGDVSGIQYFSYAGRAGRDTNTPVRPPLLPGNRIIYTAEGVNDGFVSVRSATWTGFRGCVEADHADLVGLSRKGRLDAASFYLDIVHSFMRTGSPSPVH
jgi:triacylglycerol lipase